MLKLTLFEIQRRWKMYLAVFFFYELANVLLALKLRPMMPISGGSDSELIAFVFLLGMAPLILVFVDAINSLRNEVKVSTRDLYFTLPNNAFEKVGSKLLISLVGFIGALSIFLVTTLMTFQFLTGEFIISDILHALQKNISDASYVFIYISVSYALLIGMIYLAIALYRSFFSQMKFGGVITFVLFLGVSYSVQKLGANITQFNIDSEMIRDSLELWRTSGADLAVQILSLLAVYGATSLLLEFKASFD